jgi:uncharacterized protein YheU (UPF0270 family)
VFAWNKVETEKLDALLDGFVKRRGRREGLVVMMRELEY